MVKGGIPTLASDAWALGCGAVRYSCELFQRMSFFKRWVVLRCSGCFFLLSLSSILIYIYIQYTDITYHLKVMKFLKSDPFKKIGAFQVDFPEWFVITRGYMQSMYSVHGHYY